MNNKEFIAKMAKRGGLSVADATSMVDAIVALVTERLKENDQINISGFGVLEAKKRNERSYERYRGRGGNSKPMSYYIPDTPEEPILKALELKKSRDGISKSDLVVEGLKYVLSAEIKEIKEKGEISL